MTFYALRRISGDHIIYEFSQEIIEDAIFSFSSDGFLSVQASFTEHLFAHGYGNEPGAMINLIASHD